MNNNRDVSGSVGFGFLDVLLIIFVVLKFCGVITWSWWLVLMPLWAEIALVLTVFLLMFFIIPFIQRR